MVWRGGRYEHRPRTYYAHAPEALYVCPLLAIDRSPPYFAQFGDSVKGKSGKPFVRLHPERLQIRFVNSDPVRGSKLIQLVKAVEIVILTHNHIV